MLRSNGTVSTKPQAMQINQKKTTREGLLAHVALDVLHLSLDGVSRLQDGLSLIDQLSQCTCRRRPFQVSCRSSSRQTPLDVSLTTTTTATRMSATANISGVSVTGMTHAPSRVNAEACLSYAGPMHKSQGEAS